MKNIVAVGIRLRRAPRSDVTFQPSHNHGKLSKGSWKLFQGPFKFQETAGEGLDNAKFNEDWEANEIIMNLAKEALAKGSPPHEVRELVLQSNAFREWNSMERCFAVEYHEMFIYTDLLWEIAFKRYDNDIRAIATATMTGLEIKKEAYSWKHEYDRSFDQIGVRITPVELGVSIGLFCKNMNLAQPLGILEFLGLITNNASSLLNLELEILGDLSSKQSEIIKWIEEFMNTHL